MQGGFYPVTLIPDVTVENPIGVLYTYGHEFKDGSVRQITGVDPLNVRFRARAAGVWNNTGIEVSGATIHIDHDLRLGSAGDHIRITDANGEIQALIPHINYTDADGSDVSMHVPLQSALSPPRIFQPDFSVDNVATFHEWAAPPATGEVLAKTVIFKTGAIAATEPVIVRFYKGEDANGQLFFEQAYSTSIFPANVTISLSLIGLVDIFSGDIIFHEVSSDAAFSLLGDSSDVPWHGHTEYDIVEEEVVLTNLTLSDELEITFDDEDNFVVASPF